MVPPVPVTVRSGLPALPCVGSLPLADATIPGRFSATGCAPYASIPATTSSPNQKGPALVKDKPF